MFFFLQETHSSEEDTSFWRNQWGDTISLSHGTNKSAGVAICMNNCPAHVLEVEKDSEGHWIAVVLNIDGLAFVLVNVYGYSGQGKNKLLLERISEVIKEFKLKYPTDCILIGDFNCAPDEWYDRFPTK